MENKQNNLNTLGKNIGALSARLKHLDAQKEENYQELSKLNSDLNTLLKQANDLKVSKQELTKQIQQKKLSRDKLNSEVSKLAVKMKGLRAVKIDMPRDHVPVRAIKTQLDGINMRLQTEVVNYRTEQKLMDIIRALRSKLRKSETDENKLREHSEVRIILRRNKFAADALHREIQHAAAKNSTLFSSLAGVSKRIAEMKDKKDRLRSEIGIAKIQINVLNKDLATKLSSWSNAKKVIGQSRQRVNDKLANEKAEVAQEKLKAKKKLTTEDILAMQRQAMKR
tara:strand:- start:15 stop:860 length:846 start_codon:yes stop_codon:yes gene_type:complete